MAKALEQWQIEKIKESYQEGKTAFQLAQQYNVHYRTIENYVKDIRKHYPQTEPEGQNIKIISTTGGKTLNFHGVTKIEPDKANGWIRILGKDRVLGILIESNVTAILPM